MITLRQRIIKLSTWDKGLFHDFLHDTYEKSLDDVWLRFAVELSVAFTGKPWVGKVNVDKTQFKIINLRRYIFGKYLSTVLVYGKVIVINNERWLKLTYTISWYPVATVVFLEVLFTYMALTMPPDAVFLLFFIGAMITSPIFIYWDLRQSDKRMLKYIHESRTKVYEAAVTARVHTA
ncbi:MAG TPA: hypothetical protein VIU12_01060 [Chryseolinea sp.]